VHHGKVRYIGIWAAKFCVRPLYSFVTEHAPEPENEENERSTQFWKWDFPLPGMVPLLEMGVPFPELVNCVFGYLHMNLSLTYLLISPPLTLCHRFSPQGEKSRTPPPPPLSPHAATRRYLRCMPLHPSAAAAAAVAIRCQSVGLPLAPM
jgi:hypothetical protein